MNTSSTQLTLFQPTSPFDHIKRVDENGNEYWLARELQPLLGYGKWSNFETIIERAITACTNTGNDPKNHFAPSGNMVERRQGGGVTLKDFKLSRYGCYLVAMNGDPRKEQIAVAQSYFAIKTKEAEEASNLEKLLTENIIKVSQLCERNDNILRSLNQRIAAFEEEREKAEADLKALPEPTTEAEPVSVRMQISRLVRDTVVSKGLAYDMTWRMIYRDFRDRYHVDLQTRSRNTQKPGTKRPTKSGLDICEDMGMLQEFYAVATEVLKNAPVNRVEAVCN